MAGYGLLIASLFAGATLVVADDYCYLDGNMKTCYGDFAYCCGIDNFSCCNTGYYVYSAWWFWMIWVLLFIFFTACGYAIRRRRLAARTIIIQGTRVPPPEAYVTTGTVYGATYGTQPPQYGTQPPQYGAAGPPPYQAELIVIHQGHRSGIMGSCQLGHFGRTTQSFTRRTNQEDISI